METFVKTEIENGVGRLILNRPDKRNALNREFIEQLLHAVRSLKSDDSLRVLVLQAEGSVFCAGMDLAQMQERAESEHGKQEWQKDSEVYGELLIELFDLAVPTIASLQGPVLAGGVGLVLACDLIVASERAFFMLPEPVRGITAAMVTPLLIHRAGAGPAAQLLLTNEKMSALRALKIGLCHDVVDELQLDERVHALVAAILTGSKSALAITKQHLVRCSHANLVEQIKMSIQVSAAARETDDAREGLAAFLEKRKPAWQPE